MEAHNGRSLQGLYAEGQPPIYCSPAHGPEDIICEGSDTEQSAEDVRKKRLRYENQARRCARGQLPIILSAGLRGPFDRDSGWANPWRYRAPETPSWWQPGSEDMLFTRANVMQRAAAHGLEHLSPAEALAWCKRAAKREVESAASNAHKEVIMGSSGSSSEGELELPLSPETESSNQSHQTSAKRIPNDQDKSSSPADLWDETHEVIARGVKRAADSRWLKGSYVSKRARWDGPAVSTPTPLHNPSRERDQRLGQTSRPLGGAVPGYHKPTMLSAAVDLQTPEAITTHRSQIQDRTFPGRETAPGPLISGLPPTQKFSALEAQQQTPYLEDSSTLKHEQGDVYNFNQIFRETTVESQKQASVVRSENIDHSETNIEMGQSKGTLHIKPKAHLGTPAWDICSPGMQSMSTVSNKLPRLSRGSRISASERETPAVSDDHSFVTQVAPSSRNVEEFQFKKKRPRVRQSISTYPVAAPAPPVDLKSTTLTKTSSLDNRAKIPSDLESKDHGYIVEEAASSHTTSVEKRPTLVGNAPFDVGRDIVNEDVGNFAANGTSNGHFAPKSPVHNLTTTQGHAKTAVRPEPSQAADMPVVSSLACASQSLPVHPEHPQDLQLQTFHSIKVSRELMLEYSSTQSNNTTSPRSVRAVRALPPSQVCTDNLEINDVEQKGIGTIIDHGDEQRPNSIETPQGSIVIEEVGGICSQPKTSVNIGCTRTKDNAPLGEFPGFEDKNIDVQKDNKHPNLERGSCTLPQSPNQKLVLGASSLPISLNNRTGTTTAASQAAEPGEQTPWAVVDIRPMTGTISNTEHLITAVDLNYDQNLLAKGRASSESASEVDDLCWQRLECSSTSKIDHLKSFKDIRTPPSATKKDHYTEGFPSTQLLFDAALNNPWTSNSKKAESSSRISTKRVSFGKLPTQYEELDFENNIVSKRPHSPPPPKDIVSLGEDIPDDSPVFTRFKSHFKAAQHFKQLVPNEDDHLIKSSPPVGAMAEAFIAADREVSIEQERQRTSSNSTSRHLKPRSDNATWCDSPRRDKSGTNSPEISFSKSNNGNDHLGDLDMDDILEEVQGFFEDWSVDAELKKARELKTAKEMESNSSKRRRLFGIV
ncbi:hypothetical protein G7Y89_g13502 [Cudoniella acicularis]|uniref:Protamine P1 n=1 Tax=Cudoniella acicularis TaxID=354080 RepID=A0A8H4R9Q7_9HELO|nr:hypothetical protein G7Y89_g13502 [Cudoniella acicularis]